MQFHIRKLQKDMKCVIFLQIHLAVEDVSTYLRNKFVLELNIIIILLSESLVKILGLAVVSSQ